MANDGQSPRETSAAESAAPLRIPARFQWDRLTAIMAVLIGACALGVSLYTAQLQRLQITAQTWPYLQLWRSDGERSFSVSNRGVGPAQIRQMHIFVDRTEVKNWDDAFEKLVGRKLACSHQSYTRSRVLAANEDVRMLQFCNDEDMQAFTAAGERLSREFCYCSALDTCWLLSERAATASEALHPVDQCVATAVTAAK